MELTIENITSLIKLVSEYKLDTLKFQELEIKKTIHETKEDKSLPLPKRLSDEDLLFAAGADQLPPELVSAFIRPRRQRSEE